MAITRLEFLHGNGRKSPIPLDLHLKIATQAAEALSYIHSSTCRTILHGDVKSLNILLDDEYNAKVGDFGASALESMDTNDFIMFIHGTLGYLDPETFVSHNLTDESDVYGFGVVLLELITRKKAIYNDKFNEKKALSHTFTLMFRQNKLRSMLDYEIIDDEVIVVIQKLAELVMHCLSPRRREANNEGSCRAPTNFEETRNAASQIFFFSGEHAKALRVISLSKDIAR